MGSRQNPQKSPHTRLSLEALENRVVPAAVLDYDLVAKSPANFSAKTVILQLPDGAKPDYSTGAYAPGLKLTKAYPLVPGMYQANISGQSLIKTLDALKANTRVQLVQPDAKITAQMIPNDSRFSELWGMNNTGQTGGAFDADIDAAEAWDKATGTGQTVVAVIDTGVDYNHPDLKANIWTNTREIAGNGRDDDGNGYVDDVRGWDFFNNDADPMDDNGHGTHVSGTIGAVGNNSIGVAGVNWRTRIMPLKFLGADGSGYLSGAIDAVNYAVANGARLSNNSWGGGPYDATLGKAISNAAVKGHIFVAAAPTVVG
ncbi:MAG: S8 family peptidase, partial [Gemmataceae bacterium]